MLIPKQYGTKSRLYEPALGTIQKRTCKLGSIPEPVHDISWGKHVINVKKRHRNKVKPKCRPK